MPQDFYLDECVAPTLEKRLRLHDPRSRYIHHIEHANLNAKGASDSDQLWYAAKRKAVLVTHNISDFLWLHRWWRTLHAWRVLPDPHGGILAAPASLAIDALGAAIVTFLSQHPAPLLENNMYIYKQGQWVPELW